MALLSFNYPGHHEAATPLPGMPAPEGCGSLSLSHAVENFPVDLFAVCHFTGWHLSVCVGNNCMRGYIMK